MTDTPPEPVIETEDGTRRPAWRLSLVWLVPLLALVISLAVAWRTYSDRGPLIEIVFDNASGIVAGQTTLRFRDVTIGLVEDVGFTENLDNVVLTARIDKDLARFVDDSAQFWVVRPSVTAQGVTGIETVLSGVYIEAYWSGAAGERVSRFDGLPRPPLTPADQPGLRVRLRAADGGSVAVGAPVLFKRIPVGKVETVALTDAGDVAIDVFVDAPDHLRLTSGTRFWNASGFSIGFGPGGASLNVESLLSLVQGGIAFDQVGSDLAAVEAGHTFELYSSEAQARENVFADDSGDRLVLDTVFSDGVRGLEPGAPVEFNGIRVGEVTALQAALVDGADGQTLGLRVTVSLVPQRIGAGDAQDVGAAALDILETRVAAGMRARIAASGLLGQSLFIDLAMVDDADPAVLDRDAEPNPVLPSVPSEVSSLTATAESMMQRITSLPIEDVIEAATTLLANVNALVTDEGVRAAPENLGLLLADLRTMVSDSGIRETPAEIAAAVADIRALIEEAATRDVVASLAATLETTRGTIERFGTAAEGLPPLLDEVTALTTQARDLPLEALIASVSETVAGIDTLVRSEAVTAMPVTLERALSELGALLDELQAAGAAEDLAATLAAVRRVTEDLSAADLTARLDAVLAAAEVTAANVDTASAGLPDLIDRLSLLSERAADLPFEALIASATEVVDSADVLLRAEGMDRLPADLSGTLEELRGLLAELREGGAAANVNATLASAEEAAAAITAAANDLPALLASLNRVAARADAALASVSPESEINRDTVLLLREVRDAARSVNALVTALERRPNSVLFGR
jgi:paraquat-inducible protein B